MAPPPNPQVFDATNTTRERRGLILQFAKENGYKVPEFGEGGAQNIAGRAYKIGGRAVALLGGLCSTLGGGRTGLGVFTAWGRQQRYFTWVHNIEGAVAVLGMLTGGALVIPCFWVGGRVFHSPGSLCRVHLR